MIGDFDGQLAVIGKEIYKTRVAVDTETDSDGGLLTIGLAWYFDDKVKSIALDVSEYTLDEMIDFINTYCNQVVTHYGLYDYQILAPLGARLNIVYDTYCAARIIYYDRRDGFGLKFLTESILGYKLKTIEEVNKGKEIHMEKVDPVERSLYCQADVESTLRLSSYFRHNYSEYDNNILMESRLQMVVAEMQMTGIRYDTVIATAFHSELSIAVKEIENEIHKILPNIALGSPQSISHELFTTLGLDPVGAPIGKKGYYSTAEGYLERIVPQDPVVQLILDYRKLSKLISTYTSSLTGSVGTDGAIHSHFNQFGTCTGRFSSSGPNLQNIPVTGRGRVVRKAFQARPHHKFLAVDYKQIELIILAAMVDCKTLIDMYRDGIDLHRYAASIIYKCLPEQVTKEQRNRAKVVWFAYVYGGASAFLEFCGQDWDRANHMAEDFVSRFSGLKDGIWNLKSQAYRGYVRTWYGRKIALPMKIKQEMTSAEKSALFRLAINYTIQGTAADVIKYSMVKLFEMLPPNLGHILLQIHDELVIEMLEETFPEMSKLVEFWMGSVFPPVRLTVDFEEGFNWFNMNDYNPRRAKVS